MSCVLRTLMPVLLVAALVTALPARPVRAGTAADQPLRTEPTGEYPLRAASPGDQPERSAAVADDRALRTPAQVVARILDADPTLRTYRARVLLHIHQTNFPWVSLGLSGEEYFDEPGFYVFDFKHTPSFLRGITTIEGAALDATRWPTCYDITLTTQPKAYILHMVPKINNPVASVNVTVDRSDGTIRHVEWLYRNPGDFIDLYQRYGIVDGHRVVTHQSSQMRIHYLRAVGSTTFDRFRFNVAVPTPTPTPSDPAHRCDD